MINQTTVRLKPGLAFLFLVAIIGCAGAAEGPFPEPPTTRPAGSGLETAVFAGGCFWGVEAVFEKLHGVESVVSGYSGGSRRASYEAVSSGNTGHAEAVRVSYDPRLVSYGTLLKVFFSVAHDPTQLNYQGPDHGTQYRSAIFFSNEQQKQASQSYIKTLNDAKVFKAPIVTQLSPLTAFYPAEDYHQDFMKRNPNYPYIVVWDKPKINELMVRYPSLVKK